MSDAQYDADGLVDLDHARHTVRQKLVAGYGDPLVSAQATVAANLANQLALRHTTPEARLVAGDALLEASQCLAGMAMLQGRLTGYVVVVVNVLGIAGVDLADLATQP